MRAEGAVLLFAACAAGCGPSHGGVDASAPDPDPEPAYCDPDLSYLEAPFASIGPGTYPQPDPPFERPEGSSTFITTWLMSPVERGTMRHYWILDEEPLDIRVRWMFGAGFDPSDVLMHLYLNGEPLPIDAASFERAVPVHDGLAETHVTIPAETFASGRNGLHIHYRLDSGPLGIAQAITEFSPAIAVFRHHTDPLAEYPDTEGYGSCEGYEGQTEAWWTDMEGPFPEGRPFYVVRSAPVDGAFRFVIHARVGPGLLSDCAGMRDTIAILARLDGQPIPLTPHGDRIVATMGIGECRSFEIELRDLPVDGNLHRLEIHQLNGLDAAYETAPGMLTPWWDRGDVIAEAEWQD